MSLKEFLKKKKFSPLSFHLFNPFTQRFERFVYLVVLTQRRRYLQIIQNSRTLIPICLHSGNSLINDLRFNIVVVDTKVSESTPYLVYLVLIQGVLLKT